MAEAQANVTKQKIIKYICARKQRILHIFNLLRTHTIIFV